MKRGARNELKRNFTQDSRQLVLVLKHAADGGKKQDTSDREKGVPDCEEWVKGQRMKMVFQGDEHPG